MPSAGARRRFAGDGCQAPSIRPVTGFRHQVRLSGARRPPISEGSRTRAGGVPTKLQPPRRTSPKLACFMFVPNTQRQRSAATTEDRVPDRRQGSHVRSGVRPYRVASSAFVWVRPRVRRKCQLASQSARADCRKLSTLPRERGENVYGPLIRARFATVAGAIPNTTTAHEDDPG